MKAWVHTLSALAIAVASSAALPPLLAQWPSHPTPGVPRLPDGKPNLRAPAPRTADGKPDLSGLWRNVRGFGTGAPPPGGGTGVAGTAGAPNADGSIPPRNNQFWDIGWGLKDGLPLQPWAFDLRKKRMDEKDPAARQKDQEQLRRTADDPAAHRAYVRRASLIESVRKREGVAA